MPWKFKRRGINLLTGHCPFLFVAEIPSEAVDAVRAIQDALMDEVWDFFFGKNHEG